MTNMDTGPGAHGGSGTDVADRLEDVKGQAQEAAGTAAEQGKRVTAVATDEAQKVAQEGMEQAKALLEDARGQLAQQAGAQRDHLVSTLSSLGSDLEQMSGQSEGLASDLVRQAAQRVRDLSSRLDGREPGEILEDVRWFARRRPGTFLIGAVAAGVVAGRLARGAQKAQSSGSSTGTGTDAGAVPTQRAAAAPSPAADLAPAGGNAPSAPPPTPQADALAPFPADAPGGLS